MSCGCMRGAGCKNNLSYFSDKMLKMFILQPGTLSGGPLCSPCGWWREQQRSGWWLWPGSGCCYSGLWGQQTHTVSERTRRHHLYLKINQLRFNFWQACGSLRLPQQRDSPEYKTWNYQHCGENYGFIFLYFMPLCVYVRCITSMWI